MKRLLFILAIATLAFSPLMTSQARAASVKRTAARHHKNVVKKQVKKHGKRHFAKVHEHKPTV
jgi:hypothetical protein